MSITMSKAEGVTVFTVAADPNCSVPPICQILKNLCYSPVCCSVSESLRRLQGGSLSILGSLQILVGLLNIGLGTIMFLAHRGYWWPMEETGFPYWLGGLFILFGIFCVLSERFPSPCLVTITVILNLCGIAFAITAIVLYSINITDFGFWWLCRDRDYWDDRSENVTPTPASRQKENCLQAKSMMIAAMQGINSLLIILSALQLCLSISSSVLGIKALKKRQDPVEKANVDPEIYSPLLKGEDDASSEEEKKSCPSAYAAL
ncbi:high affinity immunoglobulin epsilon receptor subunit beta-like [Synchiropus splendidus]|uniref:high affinity immunoglobulin epsilon receptor subunit beta-like n=1 Tax=Synchiropus splendidus TaxID=270530 RepID=UPI00237DC093|nr:high affinity immunoglobulin epsilon receptor subunit beta-like [Synchiropus splendidus]